MTTLNLNISDDLKLLAQARAEEEGCASLEDYVADLIRADAGEEDYGAPEHLTFRSEEELEAMLLERLEDDSPGIEATPEFWQSLKDRIAHRREGETRP